MPSTSTLATFSSLSIAALLAGLSLTTTTVSAHPQIISARGSDGAQNVLYWGQNGGNVIEDDDMSTYCATDSGVDIVIISFLYKFGDGNLIPSGTFGQACTIDDDGNGVGCDALASSIATCQKNKVKVFISIGGAAGGLSDYSLKNSSEAKSIGQNLWEAYGGKPSSDSKIPRPFGDTAVDGWDFNMESQDGIKYYADLITSLRFNFGSDTYYISGAPTCEDVGTADVIKNAQYDYVWVQFYNSAECVDSKAKATYDGWKSTLADGTSKDAKLFIGLPASLEASSTSASGQQYYRDPKSATALLDQFSDDSAFGGTMLWSAGYSDANKIPDSGSKTCTFSQVISYILNPSGDSCKTASTFSSDSSTTNDTTTS